MCVTHALDAPHHQPGWRANNGRLADLHLLTLGRCYGVASATAERGLSVLVLTRRVGETVRIGDDVEVTVLSVGHTQVRLGVAAPRAVAVHREEVFERLRERSDTACGTRRDGE